MVQIVLRDFGLGGHRIGAEDYCFVIAEAGVNHNGDLDRALAMVDAASDAGADAVKFQTFDAERLVTKDAPKADYQIRATGADESQFEMLKALELSADAHRALMKRCSERSIMFLSTPFDERSADLLANLGVAAYKTPSGELTNLAYLQHVARLGKPLIASTGMATLAEVDAAVRAIEETGEVELALLHCVSNYPAEAGTVNLRAIKTMRLAFGVPVGYSDHTTGLEIGFAAAARGASIIEKHYTLDRSLPGPDHAASLSHEELVAFVAGIRRITASLGDGRKAPAPSEAATASAARKSLVCARDVRAGETLTNRDVVALRPGTGLAPSLRDHVVGRAVRVDVTAGTLLAWEMFV